VKTAETQLADARARAANAHAAVVPGGDQPQVAQAQAAVDKARLELERTDVRAPMDGVVENADNLQVGQMAVTGVGMLSLVHSKSAWVEANFKEKDVGRMVPGQRATIEVDAYSGEKFEGHVQSIGAGTGSEFSLLPAQNANGNWVKVTQRVPVRIAFDGSPDKPMIAGLSVTAKVYFDKSEK
jgi:membrane fusion protein (multidrug efflux system)